MAKGSLEIHSENILPIIKKWLYSEKDIFIRELVSNACDAIQKVKILSDKGEAQALDSEYRIDIDINKEAKTLTFSDTGIGMDADEVKKYIAQIAFSGAEEFLQKYKSNDEKDQFIGHFGLGFYSAYMVADRVDIDTLSYKPGAEPAFWTCDGSSEYDLEKGTRTTRGTTITLHIGKEGEEFLDENHLKEILDHYCAFLPFPIYLNGEQINTKDPLWIKPPSECKDSDYIDFYRRLYPMAEDPLFWVHLNVDYPFHLKGILYFPKIKKDFDFKKNSVRLFCNRVFVSDNCKDIIPEYLMVLQGVIDSPDIPLNVSRSYLQMDRTVRQLGTHISKKVSDSLNTLYKNDRERFIKVWEDISLVIKLGAVQDEKFYDRVKDIIIWKDTDGNWTTVDEYLERNKDKTQNKIIYTTDANSHIPVLEMYRKKGIEVLTANHPIDNYLIHTIERKITPAAFQRIDANVDDHMVDKEREQVVLDEEGKTAAGRLAELVKKQMDNPQVEVEAKSLMTDSLPAFLVMDESQRRFRDYMMSMDPGGGPGKMHELHKKTLVVNTNSPLIQAIQSISDSKPELAKELVQEVYQLALLSHREMDPTILPEFIQRTNHVLEQLAKLVMGQKDSGSTT